MIEKFVRYFLALVFLFLGLNHFIEFLPQVITTYKAQTLMIALHETGYVLHVYFSTQIFAAIFFLFNRYVTFASLMVLPSVINLFLFHFILDRAGFLLALFTMGLLIVLFIERFDDYRFIFKK